MENYKKILGTIKLVNDYDTKKEKKMSHNGQLNKKAIQKQKEQK